MFKKHNKNMEENNFQHKIKSLSLQQIDMRYSDINLLC